MMHSNIKEKSLTEDFLIKNSKAIFRLPYKGSQIPKIFMDISELLGWEGTTRIA